MLGKRIKGLRVQRGLSQRQLAVMLGCPQSLVSRWETGSSGISAASVLALARALYVTTDELLGFRLEDCQQPDIPPARPRGRPRKRPRESLSENDEESGWISLG